MGLIQQLTSPTNRLRGQAVRYLFVGGIAFVADFATLVLLAEGLTLHYSWAAAVGFLVGLVVNYQLSILWVFSERRLRSAGSEFLAFSAIGVVGLGLTEVILGVGTDLVHLDYRISKLFAVAIVLLWNFGARKWLLFRNPVHKGEISCNPKPH